MNKTLVYLLAAAIIGVLVTVVHLVTIARTGIEGNNQHASQPQSLGQGLKRLDGNNSSTNSQINSSDLTTLAISFIIALLAYTLVGHGHRHKAPRRYDMRLGVPPH
jgi:hypothetical protein